MFPNPPHPLWLIIIDYLRSQKMRTRSMRRMSSLWTILVHRWLSQGFKDHDDTHGSFDGVIMSSSWSRSPKFLISLILRGPEQIWYWHYWNDIDILYWYYWYDIDIEQPPKCSCHTSGPTEDTSSEFLFWWGFFDDGTDMQKCANRTYWCLS